MKSMPGSRFELDQDIHVALGTKVITQHGAEQRQLQDLPSIAQADYRVRWNFNSGIHDSGWLVCAGEVRAESDLAASLAIDVLASDHQIHQSVSNGVGPSENESSRQREIQSYR